MNQSRLKSKVVWLSIAVMILQLIGHLGVYEKIGVTEDTLKVAIDGVLNILVLFGILNNPTNSEGF